MASGRITIEVGLEASSVARGAKDAEKALENLEDAVSDAGRSGAKDLDKIEDELKDVQAASKDTGKSVGRNLDDGFDTAEAGAKDFKSEAESTAKETAASFDGSAESIAGAFQEVAANAFSGFGPAGAVAGLAAAAGIGLVTAAFQQAEEERAALEERAADLAQAYIEAGSSVLDAITLSSRTADVLTDPESRKQAEDLVNLLGVDLPTAARLLAGDTNALAVANGIVADSEDERLKLMQDSAGYMSGQYTTIERDRLKQLTDQKTKVDELNKVNGTATETFKAQQAVLKAYINEASSATKEVDELGNELYTLPEGEQIMIEADTGEATTDVSTFKGDLDGIPETTTAKVKVVVDASAWEMWKPGGRVAKVYAQYQGDLDRYGRPMYGQELP